MRVSKLEAQRRAWDAEHLPLSEVLSVLREVLGIIGEEAGPGVAGRVAGRMIAAKARQVETLQRAQRGHW